MCTKLLEAQFLKYVTYDPKARLFITSFSELWTFYFCGWWHLPLLFAFGLLLQDCAEPPAFLKEVKQKEPIW